MDNGTQVKHMWTGSQGRETGLREEVRISRPQIFNCYTEALKAHRKNIWCVHRLKKPWWPEFINQDLVNSCKCICSDLLRFYSNHIFAFFFNNLFNQTICKSTGAWNVFLQWFMFFFKCDIHSTKSGTVRKSTLGLLPLSFSFLGQCSLQKYMLNNHKKEWHLAAISAPILFI